MTYMLNKLRARLNRRPNASASRALVNILDHGLVDTLAPAVMDFTAPDCASFNVNEWVRAWYVRDWPRAVSYGNWRRILHFPGEVRLSIFLNPLDPGLVARQLEQQATALQSGRVFRQMTKRDASIVENQRYAEIQDELRHVQVEGDPFYYITIVLGMFATSRERLDALSAQFENLVSSTGIAIERALWQQQDGLRALLPHAMNTLGDHQRNVRLDSLKNMFPFTGDEVVMPDGVVFGFNRANNMSMVYDPFAQENPHTIIIGTSGGGKSMFMKDVIEQYLIAGAQVNVIDIDGEYEALCEDLGGVFIDMGVKSHHKINVLDPDRESGLAESLLSFQRWLATAIFRPVTAGEVVALEKAFQPLFLERGFDDRDAASFNREPPVLEHLYRRLLEIPPHDPSFDDAQQLANLLYPMAIGTLAPAFNCLTNVDTRDNPLIVFGLHTLERGSPLFPRRIRQIQQFTWNRLVRNNTSLTRTIEVVDEAWFLLQRADTSEDLAERARRFRKRNGALLIATQQANDFTRWPHADTVLSIAATRILFKQQTDCVDQVGALFKLTATEMQDLMQLRPGEYLMLTTQFRAPMYKPIPPSRWSLFSTTPDDVRKRRQAAEANAAEGSS